LPDQHQYQYLSTSPYLYLFAFGVVGLYILGLISGSLLLQCKRFRLFLQISLQHGLSVCRLSFYHIRDPKRRKNLGSNFQPKHANISPVLPPGAYKRESIPPFAKLLCFYYHHQHYRLRGNCYMCSLLPTRAHGTLTGLQTVETRSVQKQRVYVRQRVYANRSFVRSAAKDRPRRQ